MGSKQPAQKRSTTSRPAHEVAHPFVLWLIYAYKGQARCLAALSKGNEHCYIGQQRMTAAMLGMWRVILFWETVP